MPEILRSPDITARRRGRPLPDPTPRATAPSVHVTTIDRSWWSWSGAHGGYVASRVLDVISQGAVEEAQRLQAFHIHFLRSVRDAPLEVSSTVEHRGRSATVVSARAHQGGELVLTATAVVGPAGSGPRWPGDPAPAVPAVAHCAPLPLPLELVPFAGHMEIRPATERLPLTGGSEPELIAWLRFRDRRPVDAGAAITLIDTLPPAVYAMLSVPVAIPTVELAVHVAPALRAAPIDDWVLARIRTEHAGDGWAVDDAALFTPSGALLATGRQTRRILEASPADRSPVPA